jgi:hypothetical protein
MGYRSDGKIWIPKETYKELPDYLKQQLNESWGREKYVEDVWSFEWWEWYSDDEEIRLWENFYNLMMNKNKPIDLLVIGEDGAVVFEGSQKKFSYKTIIKVH